MTTIATRNAELQDLITLLQSEESHKVDDVVPAEKIHATPDGLILVEGAETDAEITEDGVGPSIQIDGTYRPTEVFHEGVAEKLGIPQGYVKKTHAQRPDIWAANVEGWLQGKDGENPDGRSFMLRGFTGTTEDGGDGVGYARALLSDRYGRMDNLDVLTAANDCVTHGRSCRAGREAAAPAATSAPARRQLQRFQLKGGWRPRYRHCQRAAWRHGRVDRPCRPHP